MAKYYQHIDPSEKEFFQKTTKLLYIDDRDPDILLYYFDDGTKCAVDYIAPMSKAAPPVGLKKMVEIELPTARWTFKQVETKQQHLTERDDKSGQIFEIPDPYFVDKNGNRNTRLSNENEIGFGTGTVMDGIRYDAQPPRFMGIPQDDLSIYYASYIQYAVENNMELKKDVYTDFLNTDNLNVQTVPYKEHVMPISENKVNSVKTLENTVISKNENSIELPTKPVSTNLFSETKKQMIINADELITSNEYDNVSITYNGETYEFPIDVFFKQSINEIPEPVVETKVIEKLSEDDIDIDIINTPEWDLVNNMINMSQKEECTIDMQLILALPPIAVYKLIKTVYSPGMSDAFVKTIANRMPVKELKLALAQGLMTFYNVQYNNENNASTEE